MNDENKRLKIAYLTSEDPKGKLSWSGTTYYMAQALEKYCGDIHYLGPILSFEKRVVGRIIHESSKLFLKKNAPCERFVFVAKKQAKIIAQRLAGQTFDVIVAPIGETEIAFLDTTIPIVLVKDATFTQLHDYYPQYSNLLKRSVREGNIIDGLAYKTAQVLLYSSEWAARSAIKDYQVDKEKVYVIPFGANLDEIPSQKFVQKKKKSDRCKLLFVGRWWQRKGGDITFETLVELERMGIQAELTVCGCVPPASFSHERMKVIPFLDKQDERQGKELEDLYATSDFLLVPTRSDCTPMVFCEANAFGLPVITTNTGGVSGVIRDGENGFLLPLNARGDRYAELIAKLYRDNRRYAELVRTSRAAFEDRLNWDAWGATVNRILLKTVSLSKGSV